VNAPDTAIGDAPGAAAAPRGERRHPLIIDARMLFSSGIGRYLREILARAPYCPGQKLRFVCSSPEQWEWIDAFVPSASVVESDAGIYSIAEQWQALRLPADATYWVPHYNVPWLFRGRLVATVHDLAPLALPEAFGGIKRRIAARFFFGCVRLRARRVIAVSNFTRGELLRSGVARAEQISVIPNGVGSYWFDGAVPERRSRRLLYVGNLKPHKNLGRLVEAVEKVRLLEPIELAIAGRIDGFRTGLATPLLERLRSTPWIRLLGEATDAELRGQYGEAEALVFPSMYEGFGLPVLEAMAAGCPVVCSRLPALVEIAGPSRGAGGVVDYFDPGNPDEMADAILARIRLPEPERARLGREGRRLAAGHTWERAAGATWELLLKPIRP